MPVQDMCGQSNHPLWTFVAKSGQSDLKIAFLRYFRPLFVRSRDWLPHASTQLSDSTVKSRNATELCICRPMYGANALPGQCHGRRTTNRTDRGEVVARRVVSKDAVNRWAIQSTKASAKLESQVVPAGYKRLARVERFLAERQPQA